MRFAPQWLSALALCLCAGLAACSDDNDAPDTADATDVVDTADSEQSDSSDALDGADATDPAAYIDQVTELRYELRCERLYECPEQFSASERKRFSAAGPREACPELMAPYILSPPILDSIESGRADFNAEAARQCLDEYRSYIEADGCPPLEDFFEACSDVMTPTVEQGGACLDSSECVGDTYCTNGLFDGVCDGTCEPVFREGEPCVSGGAWECADGLNCRDDGTEYRCLPPPEPGLENEVCSRTGCAEGLICHDEDDICRTALFVERGEPCDSQTVCPMGTTCAEEIGSTTRRCLGVATLGEVCVPEADRCQLGLNCSDDGSCVAARTEGEACDYSSRLCRNDLICVDDVCSPLFETCD